MTSITSETFHEVELHIGPCYIDISIERVVPILHIGLTCNENLQWANQNAKKRRV